MPMHHGIVLHGSLWVLLAAGLIACGNDEPTGVSVGAGSKGGMSTKGGGDGNGDGDGDGDGPPPSTAIDAGVVSVQDAGSDAGSDAGVAPPVPDAKVDPLATVDDTFQVDMRIPDTVTGKQPLADGVEYQLEISGTWSPWPNWDDMICEGTPEPQPEKPSPGVKLVPAGCDAAYCWAWVTYSPSYCPGSVSVGDPPREINVTFEIDTGAGWETMRPTPDAYNLDHEYLYPITGGGVPLKARVETHQYDDNNGILTFHVTGPL